MSDTSTLVAAMADRCLEVVRESSEEEHSLPTALHPKRVLWMCDQVRAHAQEWPLTKLHRWIGFIQCAILANRMLDLEQIKVMFDELKKAHVVTNEDQDLIDHLDPSSTFDLDTGGSGGRVTYRPRNADYRPTEHLPTIPGGLDDSPCHR